jgi:hypothetical protein
MTGGDAEITTTKLLVGFFDDHRLTDGRWNGMLVILGPIFVVGGVVEASRPALVGGTLMVLWAVVRFRGYRFRVLRDARLARGADSPVEPEP